jgi:cobyrinic acid a,c-diamide synthase
VSSLADGALPDTLDALYIGGGFPETHASMLSANRTFLGSLRRAAETGMPIYAECGGLMLLSRGISWRKVFSPMAGVFPFHVQMCAEPQGHGYTTMVVDRENPFFPVGKTLRGHEFHYSRVMPEGDPPPTACSMRRGTGCSGGRDAFVLNNVWASYAHLHAVASPDWAPGLLAAARRHAVARDPSSATT